MLTFHYGTAAQWGTIVQRIFVDLTSSPISATAAKFTLQQLISHLYFIPQDGISRNSRASPVFITALEVDRHSSSSSSGDEREKNTREGRSEDEQATRQAAQHFVFAHKVHKNSFVKVVLLLWAVSPLLTLIRLRFQLSFWTTMYLVFFMDSSRTEFPSYSRGCCFALIITLLLFCSPFVSFLFLWLRVDRRKCAHQFVSQIPSCRVQ